MSPQLERWLPYADLACVLAAAAVWERQPGAGLWPLTLALLPWPVRYALTGRAIRRTPFDLPLAVFMLTALVGVLAAYDREAALQKLWQLVAAVLLFYALANAGPKAPVRGWFLAFFGAGVATYFLATNWDTFPVKIEALNRLGQAIQAHLPSIPGPRWLPNKVGGVLGVTLPFAVSVTIKAWREARLGRGSRALISWRALVLALGLLAVTSFGLVMTTARGAWLGVAAAGAVAALWLATGRLCRLWAVQRVRVFTVLLAFSLIAVAGAALAWPERLVSLAGALPGPNTAGSRLELLRTTSTLVRDYPLVGAGLGTYQMLYSTYVLLIHVGYVTSGHNLLLDVAVEQGLPGALALVWCWLTFAALMLAAGLRKEERAQQGALGAAALSLTVMVTHGLVSGAMYNSGTNFLLFAPLAFAAPLALEPAGKARRLLSFGLPIGLVLLLIAALVWRGPLLSRLYSNLGAVHQSQAELGSYTWPAWPIQDAVRRAVDLSRPVAEYERALALDARNATANRRLGMIELSLGQYEDALAHLEAAYAAEPTSSTTRQLLGEALIANGRVEEGRALWAGVRNSEGQLDARVYWYQHIGDKQRAAWMKQAAGSK